MHFVYGAYGLDNKILYFHNYRCAEYALVAQADPNLCGVPWKIYNK